MTRVGIYSRTNRSCRLVPAHQGMKTRGAGLAEELESNWHHPCLPWIPAFAGMTGVGIYSRTNDTHETGPPKSEQLRAGNFLDKADSVRRT